MDADVVVIGCGPVGAMLGNLLGVLGLSVVVLEREASVFALPRAVHFDDEIMRLLQTVGLAEAMAPLVHVSPGMRFVDAAGRTLLEWPRPMVVGPMGWHASYRFHQPELERVLRQGLERFAGVSLRLSAEVFALEVQADWVLVRYEDLRSGQLRAVRGRYVVGCDGARSLVRRMIGAPMEDLGFHERWLVVDALLRRDRPDLGDFSVQYCDPARPATYVRGTGVRRRWELAVLQGEDSAAMVEPANVQRLLSPWVAAEDVTLERAVVYTFHAALARRWRAGRLLIAGDSAHLTPPFLGQGLCAGMRDVANLAWKLGRAVRLGPADSLLESYQSERGPHVREYIELAVRLGGLINTKAMDAVVGEAVLAGQEVARMTSIKPRLGVGLAPEAKMRGFVAPQPVLDDGVRLDDRVGYRAAVVAAADVALFADAAGDASGGGAAAASEGASEDTNRDGPAGLAGDVVVVVDPGCADWLREMDAFAVVVRPDRYVLGVAQNAAELRALVACL